MRITCSAYWLKVFLYKVTSPINGLAVKYDCFSRFRGSNQCERGSF